ncbi:hypothetical protein H8B09_28950 [Paenibacillus sp. PR3]|uniref:Uncharacterized protein n=1 Tax=Paenibacillus terricola TaxID=2763503 RepID=A0ABR8N3N3_9BACL|nr:hypothetical protein [Paenibacillus terricola]MBD3922773.1 hypothetical protein [Paenibacillus terricola]
MKYRVSVNGKRKSREQVSRDRYIERLLAPIEIVEETVSQPEKEAEQQPHKEQQKQVQPYMRIKARSRKRSRTRVAFRMLPPSKPVLRYTPIKKEIRLPEQLLNRMSLPTIGAVPPTMKTSKQAVVQVRSSDRAMKRIRPRAVLTRTYSRFRMAEPPTARMQAHSSYQDIYMIFSVRTRRFSSPIRVPPFERGRKEAGHPS